VGKFDLVSLGPCVQDVLYKVDKLPGYEGLSVIKRVATREGGVAANFSVAFSHLGGRVGIITVLGGDDTGRWLLKRLGEEGVDTSRVVIREGRGSLRMHIFEDEALNRIFFVENRETLSMAPEEVDIDYVAEAAVFFTDLFLGEASLETLKKAKRRGIKTVVMLPYGLSVMEIWGVSREMLLRGAEMADLITTSLPVAMDILEEESVEEVLAKLSGGRRIVAVTAGGEGSYVTDGENGYRVPALKVRVVDTTGAGDTYSAALTYFLYVSGLSLVESAFLASLAASIKCTRMGAWSSPKLGEILEIRERIELKASRIF